MAEVEAERARTRDRVRVIEYLPAVGAGLYAVGWAAATRFYGTFEVTPEEVGIDFGYMLVRVGFVTATAAALVAGLWAATRRLQAMSVRVEGMTIDGAASIPVAGSMVYVPLAVDRWVAHGRLNDVVFAALVFASPLCLAVAYALLANRFAAFRERNEAGDDIVYKPVDLRLVHLGRVLRALVALASLAVVVGSPLWLAERAADAVRRGEPYVVQVMPGLQGFAVEDVRVELDDGSPMGTDIDGQCLLLLGQSGGTTVLYDAQEDRTYRLPSESTATASHC